MAFKFVVKQAKREMIFTKIALMAPSGGGKTYSSLRLATGMANEIEAETGKRPKILLLNTESKRGLYYANEFDYDIVDLEAPFNPEMYIDAIQFAIDSGYEIIIIDSTSSEWDGKGGCLELQQKAGGTYQAWSKVSPRHDAFIEKLSTSPVHIIATMRGKDQYEVSKDDRGKTTVQKLGVGAKQRDGFEYEFTCTFLLDQKTNVAEVQKDNTHLFDSRGAKLLTEGDGADIIKWANSGEGYTPIVKKPVEEAPVEDELKEIKASIIRKCGELGGTKNSELMDTLVRVGGSKNPNSIREVSVAKACLEALNNVEPLE